MSGDTAYPMDRIEISGVSATGYHGVFEHEKRDGQLFVVDVALTLDLRPAGRSDALADTVNYAEVAADVMRRIEGEPFDLIERLAEVIAADALARPLVQVVEVAVHEPQAPVGVPFGDVVVRVTRRRPVPVVIALGANLGDPLQTLTDAVAELPGIPGIPGLAVTAVSPLVESDPVGGPDQPAYLNAVLLGTWDGTPSALLRALHGVESVHHRAREIRWGARTLDLDLIQFGAPGSAAEVLSSDPALVLPHPRAHERAFVLMPWAAIDPTATLRLGTGFGDPVANVGELAAGLSDLTRAGVRPGPAWATVEGAPTW